MHGVQLLQELQIMNADYECDEGVKTDDGCRAKIRRRHQ